MQALLLDGGATAYGRSLVKEILANNGKLSPLGEVVAYGPDFAYGVSGIIGNLAGQKIGSEIGKRVSARKNGYRYKDFKRRGV